MGNGAVGGKFMCIRNTVRATSRSVAAKTQNPLSHFQNCCCFLIWGGDAVCLLPWRVVPASPAPSSLPRIEEKMLDPLCSPPALRPAGGWGLAGTQLPTWAVAVTRKGRILGNWKNIRLNTEEEESPLRPPVTQNSNSSPFSVLPPQNTGWICDSKCLEYIGKRPERQQWVGRVTTSQEVS